MLEQVRIAPTVVLDDFVEQTFCYAESPSSYQRPWVGMFHHPPHVPAFTFPSHALDVMFQKPAWRESEAYLVGAITFSKYLAEYLRSVLRVPVRASSTPLRRRRSPGVKKHF